MMTNGYFWRISADSALNALIIGFNGFENRCKMLDSTVLMSYLQWEGLAIFIGLSGLFATGIISLKSRLRKPNRSLRRSV
jgi:hypothetical protein